MRFIKLVWRALNNLRRLVQLLIMFVIIALVIAALSDQGITVPKKAALVVAPSGALVEQLTGDPLERAIAEARGMQINQTLVHDVIESLRLAAEDDRIKAVVLQLDEMGGGGLAKLQAIGDAIDEVRESGKPVFAVGDSLSQNQYYLAARADEIYLHELGALLIQGYDYYRTYLKSAIEKLKIDVNIFRVGKYKSFVEPFTRDDMSPEDRQSSERWLNTLWGTYTRDVEAARQLDAGTIDTYANGFLEHLKENSGNTAQAALKAGLVDFVGGRRAHVERVMEIVGPSEANGDMFSAIGVNAYLAAVRKERLLERKDARVGVLIAAGQIVDGEAPRGTIGGDTLAGLVARAADDDSIKALVLRVDSPGGSMFASEVVFDELYRLKLSGKPLVVSMSSTAASGGYYISMPADEIWAAESTITGSIGVGAIVPTFQRSMDALGLNVDGVGTTDLSGQLRVDRELGDDARQSLQLSVEEAYRIFLDKVGDSRELSSERVENLAQGRVWIGSDAQELGLVDEIGTLGDAVASAAGMAGFSEGEYDIKYVAPELTLRERIALQFAVIASRIAGPSAPPLGVTASSWVSQVLRTIQAPVGWLARLNDPRNLYYHCFCQLP